MVTQNNTLKSVQIDTIFVESFINNWLNSQAKLDGGILTT